MPINKKSEVYKQVQRSTKNVTNTKKNESPRTINMVKSETNLQHKITELVEPPVLVFE